MKTKPIKLAEVRRQFEQAGFSVSGGLGDSGPFEVRKHNCVHRVDLNRQGVWAPVVPAHFLVKGLPCELEDQGYQKFWLCDGKRFPIRLDDLRAMQTFDQEVRHILRLKSLYNEALGTTCARSVYDRVEGRPDA